MPPASPSTAPRESARPATGSSGFDATYDIVVVGGGGAGLPTALFARWLGNSVLLLEKAPRARRDRRQGRLLVLGAQQPADARARAWRTPRTTACATWPGCRGRSATTPTRPRFGLTEWEYAMCEAIYDSASPGHRAAGRAGRPALPPLRGRARLLVRAARGQGPDRPGARARATRRETMSDGGAVAIRTLSAAAERDGVDVRTGHRVQRVVRDEGGRWSASRRPPPTAPTVRVGAAQGGDLRHRRLHPRPGAAPELPQRARVRRLRGRSPTRATSSASPAPLGAQLRNMNYAWMCPVSLEKAVARDPAMSGMFSVAGDSMLFVDKRGRRVVNEKLAYNELAQTFFRWDPAAGRVPQPRAGRDLGPAQPGPLGQRRVRPADRAARHRRRPRASAATTSAELAAAVGERLERYADVTGGLRLADDFLPNLQATRRPLQRAGRDRQGHRLRPRRAGRRAAVQRRRSRRSRAGPTRPCGRCRAAARTTPPWSPAGPSTPRAGPRPPPTARSLDDQDRPIPGLYGVGNCVASASARPTGPAGPPSARSSPSPTARPRAAHAERVAEPQPAS